MDDYSWSHWKGFYETDAEMFNIFIEDLRFIPQSSGLEIFLTQTRSEDRGDPDNYSKIEISDGRIGDRINDIQNRARNQGKKQKKTKY